MALGRRDEYEANHAGFLELGESKGNLFIVAQAHVGDALLALLDGRFEDVMTAAARVLEAAPDDENFRLTYFGHVGRVGLEQDRAGEMLPVLDAARAITPDVPFMHATSARFRAASGDLVGAVELLDLFMGGFSRWGRDWLWPFAITEAAEATVAVRSTRHAEVLIEELDRYPGLMVLVGAAVMCFGSFDRYRGMLLSVLGRHDEAVAALEAARLSEVALRSPVFSSRTSYWLASALAQRGGPGDRDQAAAELASVIAIADRVGLVEIARLSRERAAELS